MTGREVLPAPAMAGISSSIFPRFGHHLRFSKTPSRNLGRLTACLRKWGLGPARLDYGAVGEISEPLHVRVIRNS